MAVTVEIKVMYLFIFFIKKMDQYLTILKDQTKKVELLRKMNAGECREDRILGKKSVHVVSCIQ